jgi:hypothetical protein
MMMNAKMIRTDHNGSFSYRQKSRLIIRISKKRCRYWKYIGWFSGVTFRAHTRCTSWWGLERLKETQQQQLGVAVLNQLVNTISKALTPMAKARLLPHVMANFVMMVAYAQQPCEIKTGQFVQEMGRWAELYEIRSFLFRMTGTLLGKEHPDALASMNDLANVLSRQGKCRQAEEMHRQEPRLGETVLGRRASFHTDKYDQPDDSAKRSG